MYRGASCPYRSLTTSEIYLENDWAAAGQQQRATEPHVCDARGRGFELRLLLLLLL